MRIQSVAARLVLVLAAVCAVVSCGDDPVTPQPGVTLASGTATSQVLYADQTAGEAQIKFTANGAWVASVMSVTTREIYREPVTWLSLSAYAGSAGDNAIDLTLTPNTTGKARKAEVHITSAGTTVTVSVEQKAEQKGSAPDVEVKGTVKQITCTVTEDGMRTGFTTMSFTYDQQGRVSRMVQDMQDLSDEWDEDGEMVNSQAVTNFTYGNGTASYAFAFSIEGVNVDGMSVRGDAKLDAQGRVVSGTLVETLDEDDEDEESTPVTYTLAYDDNGYLYRSSGRNAEGNFGALLSWQEGNLMTIDWSKAGQSERRDICAYGTQENCANIDFNWLIALDSDGAEIASGDSYKLFSILGMTGRRARNLSTRMVDASQNELIVKWECDTAGRPIKVTVTDGDDSLSEKEEYTITYVK